MGGTYPTITLHTGHRRPPPPTHLPLPRVLSPVSPGSGGLGPWYGATSLAPHAVEHPSSTRSLANLANLGLVWGRPDSLQPRLTPLAASGSPGRLPYAPYTPRSSFDRPRSSSPTMRGRRDDGSGLAFTLPFTLTSPKPASFTSREVYGAERRQSVRSLGNGTERMFVDGPETGLARTLPVTLTNQASFMSRQLYGTVAERRQSVRSLGNGTDRSLADSTDEERMRTRGYDPLQQRMFVIALSNRHEWSCSS